MTKDVAGVSGERLISFVQKLEKLNSERTLLQETIKDVYSEAKAVGFDTKALRQVIKNRAMDKEQRTELEQLVDIYESAIN